MDEISEFWGRLPRRMNDVLRASRDNNIRFLWVDDVVPGTVQPEPGRGAMHAMAFVSEDSGKSFVHYRVTVSLSPSAVEAYRKGDWRRLLPDSGTTGWLEIDRAAKALEIRCA
jgi:hypothetical protein